MGIQLTSGVCDRRIAKMDKPQRKQTRSQKNQEKKGPIAKKEIKVEKVEPAKGVKRYQHDKLKGQQKEDPVKRRAIKRKEHYEKNKEQLLIYARKYYQENKVSIEKQ